ncbi:MAG: DEAD/DEAH box helicase [Coriobacteriia bacterium]|jgi:ATP-dependent RNA helicase RhlE|nr:DEAD/DEAH box helicase [Coriobacteriia bacterium]
MQFSALGLSEGVRAGVKALGFTVPTPVQEQAIPVALAGDDVLACAQTGTGKTAAFLLPTMQRVPVEGRIRALVVTPTRELATQIEQEARTIAAHTGHSVLAVYGGVPYAKQVTPLRRGVDVLVATPGRLLDLQHKGEIDLGEVEVLVLDEADRMLDMGFWPDVRRILQLVPAERQNMLFSATLSDEVLRVIGGAVDDPVRVDVSPASVPVDAVVQYVYPVNAAQKTELLVALLEEIDEYRAIVFTRTKLRADRLTAALQASGVEADTVHSDRSQKQRERTLADFKRGKHALLVATDVMARGIDVEGVTHVINYDVPERPEDYVHRIGRTARAGEKGVAITLLAHDETESLRHIERVVGKTMEARDVEGFTYLDRVVPRADRGTTASTRTLFSGGVHRRGGRSGRSRRF